MNWRNWAVSGPSTLAKLQGMEEEEEEGPNRGAGGQRPEEEICSGRRRGGGYLGERCSAAERQSLNKPRQNLSAKRVRRPDSAPAASMCWVQVRVGPLDNNEYLQ